MSENVTSIETVEDAKKLIDDIGIAGLEENDIQDLLAYGKNNGCDFLFSYASRMHANESQKTEYDDNLIQIVMGSCKKENILRLLSDCFKSDNKRLVLPIYKGLVTNKNISKEQMDALIMAVLATNEKTVEDTNFKNSFFDELKMALMSGECKFSNEELMEIMGKEISPALQRELNNAGNRIATNQQAIHHTAIRTQNVILRKGGSLSFEEIISEVRKNLNMQSVDAANKRLDNKIHEHTNERVD